MTSVAASPVRTRTAPAATAAHTGRHRAPRRSLASRMLSLVGTLVLVFGAFALLFMTVGPRVFHYRTATMLTGSMSPGINPGDIVLDTEEPTQDIAVGQIISYHIPVDDHRVESHRVIWVHHNDDGSVSFRTQGDANDTPDPWTARADTPTVWQVRGVVPFVGQAIRFLRLPIMHLLLAIVLPACLVLWLLFSIWAPSSKDETKDGSQSDAEVAVPAGR